MISVSDAWKIIDECSSTAGSEYVDVEESLNRVLIEDVIAPIDLPPFSQSAVDGYAFVHENAEKNAEFHVQDCVGAGDEVKHIFGKNNCIQIMTGAPVPTSCDTVIMQEDVSHHDDKIVLDRIPRLNANIRLQGEDVKKSETVLKKGEILAPQHIGLLCALGIDKVLVVKKPRVAILSTGSELVLPGKPLKNSQVYLCTRQMLTSFAQKAGAKVVFKEQVKDDLEKTVTQIKIALESADVLMIAGGISVGKYDFVKEALHLNDVQTLFWKGAWRPGKPLFLGKRGTRIIFGIPGNPVACFVIAKVFIESCLKKMQAKKSSVYWREGILSHVHSKKKGFSQFARCHVDEKKNITIPAGQGSHQMNTLAKANALCWFPESKETFSVKEKILFFKIS